MKQDEGFTLAEVLVALAIFSLSVLGYLHMQFENIKAQEHVERRALAALVAENQLALIDLSDAPLKSGVRTGTAVQGSRDWDWRETVTRTDVSGFYRIDIDVMEKGDDALTFRLTGFKGEL